MAVGSMHVQLEKFQISGAALRSMTQFEGPVYKALKGVALGVKTLARAMAPYGPSHSGHQPGDLIASIDVYEIETPNGVEFLVGSELIYTAMEEFRHRTHAGFLRKALDMAPSLVATLGFAHGEV